MAKNSLPRFVGLLLASVTLGSAAALPPKYLGIKDFKLCLATQEISSYRAWCMPSEKPENCPATSWKELKALTGTDKLPDCPANSGLSGPLPTAK